MSISGWSAPVSWPCAKPAVLAKTYSDTTTITDCVREGEAVLVQVIKDPMGEKGARLSAGITLPGRLLVMTPGQPGLALSRRIEDETSARLP